MLAFFTSLFAYAFTDSCEKAGTCANPVFASTDYSDECISFTVAANTGCQWMCDYCSNQLVTDNYFFTTDVCTYEEGGCVGNPQEGVLYTCCAV